MSAVGYCTIDAPFTVLMMSYPKGNAYFVVNIWVYPLAILLRKLLFHHHSTLEMYKPLFVAPQMHNLNVLICLAPSENACSFRKLSQVFIFSAVFG